MKLQCQLNLMVLAIFWLPFNLLISQNRVSNVEGERNGPKVLLLNSSGNIEGNKLVYDETKNIVFSRLKKNLDKFNVRKTESNYKQFTYNLNKNSIDFKWKDNKIWDSATQPDFIFTIESYNKSLNSGSSEMVISSFNGCNFVKLTEKKLQFKENSNWIKNDKQFVKIDSLLQSIIYNSIIENVKVKKIGIELDCVVEFNLLDSNNLDFYEHRKQGLLDSIEFWIINNSLENQYYLKSLNQRSVQFNSIRVPLFDNKKEVCLDAQLFFQPLINLIPNSELQTKNLPQDIDAIVRINN